MKGCEVSHIDPNFIGFYNEEIYKIVLLYWLPCRSVRVSPRVANISSSPHPGVNDYNIEGNRPDSARSTVSRQDIMATIVPGTPRDRRISLVIPTVQWWCSCGHEDAKIVSSAGHSGIWFGDDYAPYVLLLKMLDFVENCIP